MRQSLIVHLRCIFNSSFWRLLLEIGKSFNIYYIYFLIYFFIEGELLYRILLFSVKAQHESAIGIHIAAPF